MCFPPGQSLGKRVPLCVAAAFSLRPRPAQSSILRGTGGGSADAEHGRQKFDKHRIRFGSRLCAENPRVRFANPHRLRSAAGVLARGLKTLTRFPNARALHRVRFSAVWGSVGARRGQLKFDKHRICFWVEALRGESAYLLRKSAPASAACRRPRPRAKNAHAFS